MAKAHPEVSEKAWEEMQKWERADLSSLALSTAQGAVRRRPVVTGVWAFGMLLAVFAGGLPVSEDSREAYTMMLQHAEVVDSRELGRLEEQLGKAESALHSAQGWFGACDDQCRQLADKAELVRAQAQVASHRRDEALSEARQEVGIWSIFGVQDVRRSFWDAVQSGKAFAARCTMYDALFMSMSREETLVSLAIKLVLQYVVNLTLGLVGAFFYFLYNMYLLIVSYGSAFLSGLAFFMLAAVAGVAMLASYLGMIYLTVAGAGMLLLQHAAHQAALEAKEERKAIELAQVSRRFPPV